MLRNFLYLDTVALADYVSTLEGGVLEELEKKKQSGKMTEGAIAAYSVRLGLQRTRGSEEAARFSDSPPSQFQRLLDLAENEAELAGWVPVVNFDEDLAHVGIGALIDLECDIYIPDLVKFIAPGSLDAIAQMEALLPLMEAIDPSAAQGIPSAEERAKMKTAIGAFGGKTIAVGDLDASDWHLAGQLKPEFLKGEIEGPVRITGKVASRWARNEWKPLLALPGSSLMSRAQRRGLEKKKPNPGSEDQFLEGPALMLDILAIYR